MDIRTQITRFCRYQERCQKEVRNKLYECGATRDEVDELMIEMISQGLVDEERYAKAFARGKFRIKNWGRNKIVYELKQNQVSSYCIDKGLSEIDEAEYLDTLERLANKKLPDVLKDKNVFARRAKMWQHLVAKGYENELVAEILKKLF